MSFNSRHFTFTHHDYTDEIVEKYKDFHNHSALQYIVIGYEVAPTTGRPHLQGYMYFKNERGSKGLSKYFGKKCYLLKSYGSPTQNRTYALKEGKPCHEWGTIPNPGARTDIQLLREAIKSGNFNRRSLREISDAAVRYPEMVDTLIDDYKPKRAPPQIELYDWQERLVEVVKSPPHDRKIYFVVDVQGCGGKTTFGLWLSRTFDNVQILQPGKKSDMAYCLKDSTTTLIVDCPRCRSEYFQYDFLEEVKNGMVFSTKYQSRTKELDPCHVIVFMNEMPDMTKLSQDRYEIVEL